MNHKKYLTIGDVSKIMHVGIKSLRYYDRIGILTPAYVDPETGYRYYLPSQLGVVQAIQFCVEIGIPLKRFSAFYTDNKISTMELLDEAAALADQKIRVIQQGMALMAELRETMKRNEALERSPGPIEYEHRAGWYILAPVRESQRNMEGEMELNRMLSRLQMIALDRGLQTGLSAGYLHLYRDGSPEPERYVYSEVYGTRPLSGHDILSVPAGTSRAICVEESRIEDAAVIFRDIIKDCHSVAVFESEIISGVFNTQKPKYELRCCELDIDTD